MFKNVDELLLCITYVKDWALVVGRLMSKKLEERISHVCWWVNGWVTIEFLRSYSRMIRGDPLPSPLKDREPDWDPILGLFLTD